MWIGCSRQEIYLDRCFMTQIWLSKVDEWVIEILRLPLKLSTINKKHYFPRLALKGIHNSIMNQSLCKKLDQWIQSLNFFLFIFL